MKILLFDIDGTLMDSGGAGVRALDMAFADIYGISGAMSNIPLAGNTDLSILREALSNHGLEPAPSAIGRFCESYTAHLSREIISSLKLPKPGIPALLDALKAQGSAGIGLLTGNIEAGARIKLTSIGIADYFSFGAFGSDEYDRDMLLPHALRRYKALTGREARFDQCVVIGDTPRDVNCAKPYGAFSLAVATGPFSSDELARAGADAVLKDLSETETVMDILLK